MGRSYGKERANARRFTPALRSVRGRVEDEKELVTGEVTERGARMDWTVVEGRPATSGVRLLLRVPPDPSMCRSVRERLIEFTAALDIPEDDLADFLTAVGEALANALEHARASDPIEVSAWMADDQIVATVVDRGVGFRSADESTVETHPPDFLRERGRGLPIMRSCCDLFSVRSDPGEGTAVTLGRYVRRGKGPERRIGAA